MIVEEVTMNKYPSQTDVDKALKTIELQQERERRIQKVKKEIGYRLEYFIAFNFRVDKKNKQIIFAGTNIEMEVKIGISKCQNNDVWNSDIGKLIAIRRALNVPTDDLMDLVETEVKNSGWKTTMVENNITFPCGNFTITFGK